MWLHAWAASARLRVVAGRNDLLDGLRTDVLRRTRGNSLFLAHMVGNALTRQPPLGLFGGLNTIRSGEHKLDLKQSGIVPVVDLARVYALAAGQAADKHLRPDELSN